MQDITFGQLEEKRSLLQQLRLIMERGIVESQVGAIHGMLDYVFSAPFAIGRPEIINVIHRVTINRRILRRNARLYNISYFKYPPVEFAGYGRCNTKQHSILYAGFDFLTILSELKPEAGDLITVSSWENSTDAYMSCFTVVGHQPAGDITNLMTLEAREFANLELSKYPPNIRALYTDQLDFLADSFSRQVSPRPAVNYIFSAFFCKKTF